MPQKIQAGLQILRHNKHCHVGQIRLTHQSVEIHSDDGNLEVVKIDALRHEMVTGDVQMLVTARDGTFHPVSTNWRECEGQKAATTRNKRSQILMVLDEELKKGNSLQVAVEAVKALCKEKGWLVPCERTLRSWRQLVRGHESMLSPAWARCGNRHQGPDELLIKVMTEVVKVAILGTDRFTVAAAWRMVEAKYDCDWKQKNGDKPKPSHSRRKLKNYLRTIPWDELMKARLDGRTSSALTRTAVHLHTADVFWECVEMDATFLDLLVRDESGNEIGRPVLYVAVDVATGYVVGLHLTIQKPSTLPFVECLRFMYFPKPEGFDEKYSIKHRIEVFGKPILAHVDNGSEFIGKTATEIVRVLFGDTARCKPYTPKEKPHVERFNGTLKAFILTLPGATTSSVIDEMRTPPKNEKLLTLEELRGEIYRFTYDKYALQVNNLRSLRARKAVAPADIWREMKLTYTEPVPVDLKDFDRSLCFKRQSASLGHDGISFDGWKYHSDELAKLYRHFGPGKCEFLSSDLDATTIYVKNPDDGELVAAFEKTLERASVDRPTAKLIKRKIAAEAKLLNSRTFDFELTQLKRLQETAKSSHGRAKQARFDDLQKSAEAQVRRSMPLTKPTPEATTSHGPIQAEVNVIQTAPRGRKMGEKR
jgi:transposase InsO family protein